MMKVLLIAPNIDATDVGEALMAFKWAEALCDRVALTVLTFQRPGRPDVAAQLPGARVVTWPEPSWARTHERLNAMLKPAWPVFARRVRSWIGAALAHGDSFDVAHQLMPQAARYASPLRHFAIPYIIGPLGGALDTPAAFRAEATGAPLFTRLRALDAYRFRHDPWLRDSYARAACILGVAPYVRDVLADVPMRRFEPVLELGIDDVAPLAPRRQEPGRLRVLHVGRAVRTKGLRDTVRALALVKDLPGVTLTSAGAGEELELCRAEAARLGVADRVTFHGRIARSEVEALYASHDVFCFPSFREPAGGVLYEAMRHGLPVITADRGGPAWIVDAASGFRLPVTDPATYAADIATSLRRLALSPELTKRLGQGARGKVLREGLWSAKADRLVDLYRDVAPHRIAHAVIRKDRPACA
ncbi:glycosyltransferase family 4 protein [Aestuariicoccus sp. MJ-SS9]|uniref:glycosyltransferase family 4 protein n=1 Tax=Aestuariicoccus sp. MJ-SS9 TaxID=3079855 RepID=UPI00290F83A8|nr:glycosyltransferase family 4 protein [Aestuariicoccus sp. MJ-SS9]MDU8913707.1 glycosyltransferase family 4 protein [Aestuariicoccus sp. MJ-SS9]